MRGLSILGSALLLLSACSNSGPSAAANNSETCSPSGTALTITAPGLSFDKHCLAAPAGQAFTITLNNQQSGIAHNVLISQAFALDSPTIFNGQPVTGPGTITYNVAPMSPGTYSFECSLHPGLMHGTFIVVAASLSTGGISPPASSPQTIYTGTPSPTATATSLPN
jgi:plastocyanin